MSVPDLRGSPAVRWQSLALPAAGRELHVRVFRPDPAPHGWLVWAHGGSWRAGSVDGWHDGTADLAAAAGATVVSVDYRLAPGHRHPAALVDVLTALDWAQAQSPTPVAVGGDSAGGTLAACAALVWRDRRRPLAAQVLAYPPIDPECRAPSYRRHPLAFPSRAGLIAAWRDHRGALPRHPAAHGATPLYSTPHESDDLGGLAPAVLAVGSADPVADDVRGYAALLHAAGNTVELREFDGLPHGTFLTDPGLRDWLGTAYSDHHRRSA
ncbi:hypothetical protein KNE206_08220 [Kitasatospora sp. NE20-6]|uniref:alpha/beta hydrolase fold domain-containing protein n=1 Tax=Kitasatospora sp. NE20-6 TaxID=2859066 RepID=UPI0034DC2CDC